MFLSFRTIPALSDEMTTDNANAIDDLPTGDRHARDDLERRLLRKLERRLLRKLERRLLRKLDLRMSIIVVIYTLNYVSRVAERSLPG